MINTTTRRSGLRRIGAAAAATTTAALGLGLLSPVAAHAQTLNACSGAQHKCTVVANVDVTGDNKLDSVGIVVLKRSGTFITSYRVRVLTAGGKLVLKTDNNASWEGNNLYYGAAAIDGWRGKELVVGHIRGAHTDFDHVLAYRGGKLELREMPQLPAAVGKESSADRQNWVVDGSVSTFTGIARRTSYGQVTLLENTGARDAGAGKYKGWHVAYRWSDGHWKLASYNRQSWTDDQSAKAYGWRVPGLRTGF